tara:strand:- start:659 stop:1669 length:1011 start_codon:yes stop_codon:yes gene_type:complete
MWIKNLAVIIGSIFISLILFEIGFRYFEIGYGNNPLENSRTYHHVHPKNYSFKMHDPNSEYGGHIIYYDDNRFLSPDQNTNITDSYNTPDSIIFLGDSFTEGVQVNYQDSFVSLVNQALDLPTLNLGVSSYSPIIYYLQSKYVLNKLLGKTVIMQIYVNDFYYDNFFFESAVFKNNELVGIDGGTNNIINLMRKSYVARFIRRSQLIIKKMISKPSNFNLSGAYEYEQNISDADIKNTVKIIKKTEMILKEQNKRLFVFLVPSKSLSLQNKCCQNDNLYKRFYNQLAINDISLINVATYFENYDNQNKLFFPIDTHLTEEGHKLISEAIVNLFNIN